MPFVARARYPAKYGVPGNVNAQVSRPPSLTPTWASSSRVCFIIAISYAPYAVELRYASPGIVLAGQAAQPSGSASVM